MSDDTPATPPSAALYPILVTPPESGNSMENPILISDSDGPDASDTETLCELVRQLSDNSPSPSPRAQRLTRHSGHVNRSQVNSSVKQPDHVENTTESGRNLSDPADDATHRHPIMPIDGQNGGTSPESRDTGRPVEGTPAASVRPMPIWELETNIKEVILKTATNDEKGDIGFSSCQKCLRLRLKAWTDVTDLDYFEYECRMRIGWGLHRQVMFLMWPLLGNSALTLIDGCERLKRLASFLWAPMTHLHLLLLLVLSLLLSSNASRASVLSYVISCIFAYCRIRSGLSYTPKAHTIPQPPHKKATRTVSKSPALRIPPEAASEKEMPDTEEPPSEKRPVSRHRAHDISNTPRGQSAPGSPEMSDISEYNRPNPFLTPDRATRTVGKNSPKAGAKRRKSDVR
ncbi:hypothetical protein KXX16_000676 [Aspergillus fumigatus]|nr:hypothetical protein KXX38_009036 [Aspergillus fumigatus]KAH1350963.1 hypothetical protein KXX33_000345 [Aspergillus fumigatus]KAH1393789.1 hypothetical protein KXX49_000775 [Aspergillus fumigatus]KAH1420689.1 hypothetical protein KXX64_000680 [Aspergillus fumigatus]KAH1455529.1 hypothetical protein KXX58_001120 [Aspergillus fumigatus]